MNGWRLAAWSLFVAVCGAWLASAAGISRYQPVSRPPQVPAPNVELTALAADVQAQAGRLRSRLSNAPAPSPLDRNPFAFHRTPARVARQAAAPAPEQAFDNEPAPAVPTEPFLTLIGMAEQKVEGGTTRTAMLADDRDSLIMARVGDRILDRYEVVQVSSDAIELRDLQTDAIRRLILQ